MRPYYYLGANRGLTRLVSGQQFYVNTKDWNITPWIVDGGYWELFVDELLLALTGTGDTVADIGANMGYYTVKLGGQVGPNGRVYSFEPNPETYVFLRENVALNALEGVVRLHNAALGAEPGEALLNFDEAHPGGAAINPDHQEGPGVRVPVLALDAVIETDCPLDVAKIDVEGFEPLVLLGMKQTLARSPEAAVVVEFSYPAWSRFGDPRELLEQAAGDREIYLVHGNGRIEPLAATGRSDRLNPGFLSYVLLLPRSERRRSQVKRFLGGPNDRAPISYQLARRHILGRKLRRVLRRLTGI
jgi:FkbM family methyltransferase